MYLGLDFQSHLKVKTLISSGSLMQCIGLLGKKTHPFSTSQRRQTASCKLKALRATYPFGRGE